MDELMNLKYLTQNNGYWQYERRVPKRLLDHPYWDGKAVWKRPLSLKTGAAVDDVIAAWNDQHQTFESALSLISERNLHILDKRERRQRAETHLKMHGLKPHDGSSEGIDDPNERSHHSEYLNHLIEHSGAFDDYVEWAKIAQQAAAENGSGLLPPDSNMPSNVRLQKEAWIAFTDSKGLRAPVVFGDLWDIYARGKDLDITNRSTQKTRRRWKSFLDIVGDEVLTNQSVNDGLRAWLNAQRARQVQDQTLKRELGVVRAILNYARQAKALDLQWVIPELKITTEEKQRPVIEIEDYQALWALIQDTSNRRYRPWKEFVLTILCQSSTIQSELMRLEKRDIHLDGEIPYISLYDSKLKTKDRKRIVPLPFRAARLKELVDEMDEGQFSALPPSLVKTVGSSYEWATSESNINHQINDYMTLCDSSGLGYTSYSTRHSFKLYLHLAGANPMDILYLAGWAGDNEQSHMLKHYGRQGIGSPAMVKQLYNTAHKAMYFLETSSRDTGPLAGA